MHAHALDTLWIERQQAEVRTLLSFATIVAIVLTGLLGVRVVNGSPVETRRRLAQASLFLAAVVTVTDWPSDWLADFWADHAVLSGTIVTTLLLGAGLLGLDVKAEQQRAAREKKITEMAINDLREVCTGAGAEVTHAYFSFTSAYLWDDLADRNRVFYESIVLGPTGDAPLEDEGEFQDSHHSDFLKRLIARGGQGQIVSDELSRDIAAIRSSYRGWAPLLAPLQQDVLVKVATLLSDLVALKRALDRSIESQQPDWSREGFGYPDDYGDDYKPDKAFEDMTELIKKLRILDTEHDRWGFEPDW